MYILLWCVICVIFIIFAFFTVFILPEKATPIYVNLALTGVLLLIGGKYIPLFMKWYEKYVAFDILRNIFSVFLVITIICGIIYTQKKGR